MATTRIEVGDDQIEGLALGDRVRVTQEGKIVQLEARRTFDDIPEGESFPPEISIEVDSTKIEAQSNEFTTLAELDD